MGDAELKETASLISESQNYEIIKEPNTGTDQSPNVAFSPHDKNYNTTTDCGYGERHAQSSRFGSDFNSRVYFEKGRNGIASVKTKIRTCFVARNLFSLF